MQESFVFFGSGPVAAESLELLAKDFVIEAVVTKPKPAHHRGNFPVLDVAARLKLPVYTVSNKDGIADLVGAKPFRSCLGVLIDFGIIVGQDAIDSFPLGIVNSHFSLLPQWRGADPISFSILSGQPQTGVSLMLLVDKLDEGPLLAVGTHDIGTEETTPSLTASLIELSTALLHDSLPKYVGGEIQPAPQEETAKTLGLSAEPTYARKLTQADGLLDWQKPAQQLEREIRAFLEWPKSHATLAGKDVIITKATVVHDQPAAARPGDITADKRAGRLIVATSNGSLSIERLKPAGKAEMTAKDFLIGYGSQVS